MPLGVGLAIGGIGAGLGIWGASKNKSDQPAAQADTGNLVSAATAGQPPSAVQSASDATDQAGIAASKQRKKAAAGDTLLTPTPPAGGYKSGTPGAPAPAALVGSK